MMNAVEMLLARASGRDHVRPGDLVEVEVDLTVLIDANFLPGIWLDVLRVDHPDRVVVVLDHFAPASDVRAAEAHARARAFARRFGIERFHDIGPSQGISHQLVAERGYAGPGDVVVCADSHTCSAGALGALARGVGPIDAVAAACTGRSWFACGETVRYELHGRLAPGVGAKDLFLAIAGRYGSHNQQNLEFHGPGVATLSVDERRTVATMCAEVGAELALFPVDDVLRDHLAARGRAAGEPVEPEAGARYAATRTLDLGSVVPMVATPGRVHGNVVEAERLPGPVRIDQAFVGSCANGTIEDLRVAASIVAGRSVAPGVRFVVTPASEHVHRVAVEAGWVAALLDAGAVVTPATCGACAGLAFGVVGAGEVVVTSSTRNFRGRMGSPDAAIYLASTATVAASALAGRIVDPRGSVP